jgi:hypothetical protein
MAARLTIIDKKFETESGMAAETTNDGGLDADRDMARMRTVRLLSVLLAIGAFAILVVGFALNWAAYYQVAAGLAAYIGIEWQRRVSDKIRALDKGPA